MRLDRLTAATAAITTFALLGAGCATSPADSEGAPRRNSSGGENQPIPDGPITIGASLGLTGFVSFYDGPLLEGVEMAIEEINAEGGVLGHELELITADTKSDPAQIASAAEQVLDDGAQFLVPTMDYDFGGPAARVASSRGIVSVTTSGDPRMGLVGIGPYAFNLYPAGPTEGTAAAEFAYADREWTDVYVLEDDSASHPKTVCENFTDRFESLGGTITGSDTFQSDDQSIATQITRLRSSSSDTDAIMLCSYPPGGVAALKQLRAAGLDHPVILDAAFDGTFWLEALPDESNTFVMSTGAITPGETKDAEQARVLESYTDRTGDAPVFGVGLFTGYSAVQALVRAIESAESVDSDAVADELETFTDEQLLIGKVTWTSECHVPIGQPLQVLQIVPGAKQEYVATVTADDASKEVC